MNAKALFLIRSWKVKWGLPLTLIATVFLFSALACAARSPAPTPTPTFEQKRSGVLNYLRAFNSIENRLNDTLSQIPIPRVNTAADLEAFNTALTKLRAAFDNANQRIAELHPPAGEPDAPTHLERAKTYFVTSRDALDGFKDAVASQDQNRVAEGLSKLATTDDQARELNKNTEQLLLKYNISDEEANYKFRGK